MNDMILKALGINPQDIKEYADKLALAMKYAQEKAETISNLASGNGYNNIAPELPCYTVMASYKSGDIGVGVSQVIGGDVGLSNTDLARMYLQTNPDFRASTNIEIIGASFYAYGNGSAQTISVEVGCMRTVSGVGDVDAPLITITGGTANYGYSADSAYTELSPLKLAATEQHVFYIKNNSAAALLGCSVIIRYRIRSNGAYI